MKQRVMAFLPGNDEGDTQKNEKKFEKGIDNLIPMQYI